MDLLKAFGIDEDVDNIGIMDVLRDFVENCGDYGQILKGGMALNYYYDNADPSSRNTVDLDFHIRNKSHWNMFKNTACNTATNNSKLGCTYSITKIKINPNGESLSLIANKADASFKFRIDMNYGDYCKINNKFNLNIYSIESILADKISVICSNKILRRTKDLYDVYLILSNETFNSEDLAIEVKRKLVSRNIELNTLYLLKPEYLDKLSYSYYKLKLIDYPTFEDIINTNLSFLLPFLDIINGVYKRNIKWDNKHKVWIGRRSGSSLLKSLEGIVCKESASGLLNLSTFPPFPLLVYNDYLDLTLKMFRFIKQSIPDKDKVKLNDTIYVTNEERTICDMLIDGEFRILMESLESYMDSHDSLDLLEKKAMELNLSQELKNALNELYNN